MSPHSLFSGQVMHHRHHPVTHRFDYPMFALELDIDRLDAVPGMLRVDRPGLLAFHRADHGPRDGGDLGPWIRRLLAEHGLQEAGTRITLFTQPRILGYVFNPVSFWFCHDREQRLRAVLAEVNNTFGEHHNYLVRHADRRPLCPGDVLPARKVFHVSPFLDVAGDYRFRFAHAGNRLQLAIGHQVDGARLLSTAVWGDLQPLTGPALLRRAAAMPWQALAVTARIHWQALGLWFKGAAFHAKPSPPLEETST